MARRAPLFVYGSLSVALLLCAGLLYGAAVLLGRRVDRGGPADAFVPAALTPYRDPDWRGAPSPSPSPSPKTLPAPDATAAKIVTGARAQVGDAYVPGYAAIAYPNGDVPKGQGVCTDVVVRALRAAGYDLQRLVHEDMAAHFGAYPREWGLRRPDTNIDHRRVPNLRRFFERRGRSLPAGSGWEPGDIVTWRRPNGLAHTGIVSDRLGTGGAPLVIHNIGTCAEEDALRAWPVTGHYRFPRR
jgi:uncharacterized protein YijF (DUF1287 family)